MRFSINIGLGLAFAALLAIPAGSLAGEHRDWLLQVAVGLVTGSAMLLRERNRLAAAVFGIGVCAVAGLAARIADLPREPGPAATMALLVLVGAAVRVVPVPAAVGVAAGVVVLPLGWLAVPVSGSAGTQLAAGIVGWCGALAVGLWLRLRDERRDSAADTVRREERLALARELHDLVAHHITGVVLQAQAARVVAGKQPEVLDGTLASIETAGTAALADMRRVVGLLRDADDGAGTAARPEQLAELVRRFAGRGPSVRLNLPDGDVPIPPELTSTVYRLVQESLTNIARHAPGARQVTVDVAHDRDGVTVQIVDDAPSSLPPGVRRSVRGSGFGLVGMRERVEAFGGTLLAGPRPDGGWSVRATLPVREPR